MYFLDAIANSRRRSIPENVASLVDWSVGHDSRNIIFPYQLINFSSDKRSQLQSHITCYNTDNYQPFILLRVVRCFTARRTRQWCSLADVSRVDGRANYFAVDDDDARLTECQRIATYSSPDQASEDNFICAHNKAKGVHTLSIESLGGTWQRAAASPVH